MSIDREQALQLVTDRLCGELDGNGAAALQAYLEAHPEFAGDVKELEAAWRKLELLAGEGKWPAMGPELRRALGEDDDELSDEDLDLAAGGLGRPALPEDEPPDRP
jgi:hypothetical protein